MTPVTYTIGRSGRWNKTLVALVFSLKLNKVVIAAGGAIGIVAADLRAALINRATSLVLIEKHAHRFVDMIFSMTQHSDCFAFVLYGTSEFFSRNRNG